MNTETQSTPPSQEGDIFTWLNQVIKLLCTSNGQGVKGCPIPNASKIIEPLDMTLFITVLYSVPLHAL